MTWNIEFGKKALKSFKALGFDAQECILTYIYERLAPIDNPKTLGKALIGKLKGLWRYRVGDYRIVCRLEKETITIFVIDIGHRKEIYK